MQKLADAAGRCNPLYHLIPLSLHRPSALTKSRHSREGGNPGGTKLSAIAVFGMKRFYVYILASERNGTLYIGMTSNLPQRIWQHKEKVLEGFTNRYDVYQLVYFEEFGTAEAAITKEKQIKKWNRAWKIRLIEEQNPTWCDLYDSVAM